MPRRDRVRLVGGQDAPMKAICPARWGVPDDPARLAFRVNEQLGARAEAAPLRGRRGFAPLPGAQFTGELPEVFGVILGHVDGHSPQSNALQGSGWGPPLTHRGAPRRTSGDWGGTVFAPLI